MSPRSILALSAVTSASLLASAVLAQPATGGQRAFTVALTGSAEVPGPGDTDGAGTAKISVNVPKKQVCYELRVSGIATATAAHIHAGATGIAGPPVVTLDAPASGASKGCVDVTAKLAAQILGQSSRYYVNVHTGDFPAGAIRGQLK